MSGFKKNVIKIVTMKVILDIVMGYSTDLEEQKELLRGVADDIENEEQDQILKDNE